jgi:4-amino-4-deoxy-L-arabinose transferase-like glycosyltransferase
MLRELNRIRLAPWALDRRSWQGRVDPVTVQLPLEPYSGFLGKELKVSPAVMWAVFWFGAATFVPLLFLQYVGEEAVYTIIAQEMRTNKEYLLATLYGQSYGRPSLFSFAILLLSDILGGQNILVAARLITATATVLTGLTLAWLIRAIFQDRFFAAFGAAVFLSGDVLLRRGWLAYSDPTFSFFTFGAMACLWVATEQRRYELLLLATLGLIGSFLTKVPTGYVYYGVLATLLLWRHPNRQFLLTPWSLLMFLIAVAVPILWNYEIAANSIFPTVWGQALSVVRESGAHGFTYYAGRFVSYPLRLLWHLMPISAIVLYCLWSRKLPPGSLRQNSLIIAGLTVAINLLPYWFVPGSRTRYIMPIYPLLALCMTYVVLHSGRFVIDLSAKALSATVAVAFILALAGDPLYERYFRGGYGRAAEAIIARAGDSPIFATDHSSIGLSIVAELNTRRPDKAPISIPPARFTGGFVLVNEPDPGIGAIDTVLQLGQESGPERVRYLLCRGDSCAHAEGSSARRLLF